MSAVRRITTPLGLAGAVALVTLPLYAFLGAGYLGYDAAYAIVWGDALAGGHTPDFEAPFAPTPHPLSNLGGIVLSLAGAEAPAIAAVLSLVWLAVVAVGAFDLGRSLISIEAGVLFALLLLTRPLLVAEALHASADIPFLALVVIAAALQARRDRPGAAPLVLLVVAGLLRPEAWALAVLYALWWSRRRDRPPRPVLAGGALAAPVAWVLFDLAATGEPLHSLHGTRELAEQLDRPRYARTAFDSVSPYLDASLGTEALIVGLVGVIAALWLIFERVALPAAIAGVGLAAFFVLAVFGLPVLSRYLLLPSAMLAFFCATALVGWRAPELSPRVRRAWLVGGAVAAVVVLLGVSDTRESLRRVPDFADSRREIQDDLRDAVEAGVALRCGEILVPSYRMVPLVAYWSGAELEHVRVTSGLDRGEGAGELVRPGSYEAATQYVLDVDRPTALEPPERATEVTRNRSWAVYERC